MAWMSHVKIWNAWCQSCGCRMSLVCKSHITHINDLVWVFSQTNVPNFCVPQTRITPLCHICDSKYSCPSYSSVYTKMCWKFDKTNVKSNWYEATLSNSRVLVISINMVWWKQTRTHTHINTHTSIKHKHQENVLYVSMYYINIHTCICIYIHTYMYIHIYILISACIYTYI